MNKDQIIEFTALSFATFVSLISREKDKEKKELLINLYDSYMMLSCDLFNNIEKISTVDFFELIRKEVNKICDNAKEERNNKKNIKDSINNIFSK